MNNRSVQSLLRDHRTCEEVQAGLVSLLDALEAHAGWKPEHRSAFEKVCRFYRGVVLAHIRKEEEVLFPALEAYLPRDTGPLAVLRGEHREISACFERLCQLGRSFSAGAQPVANPADQERFNEFSRIGRGLVKLLDDHIYKEDRVLFPMVARFLTAERDAHILEQMETIGEKEDLRREFCEPGSQAVV